MSDDRVAMLAGSLVAGLELMDELRRERSEAASALLLATVGRLVEHVWLSNGVSSDDDIFAHADAGSRKVRRALDAYRDDTFRQCGAPWQQGVLRAEPDQLIGWVDFDMRPDRSIGRWGVLTPDLLVGELMVKPRESVLVPSWMKVELAVAGLWDVDRDVASWDSNFEPLSCVVSREVAEAAFSGQPLVSEVLFGAGGPPAGLSRSNPLVVSR